MSANENKALVRRFVEEVWNQGNLGVIEHLVAPDFQDHGHMAAQQGSQPSGQPGEQHFATGPEGTRHFIQMIRSAFPDIQVTIEQELAEGDLVATHWTIRGTQHGPFMGIEPTGKQIQVQGVVIDRCAGGKVAEEWIAWDRLGLLQQLGAVQR
jgi:steroid delta-isomerase-like uncharacterized protein